jgi:DUF971 family protein
MSSSEEAFNYEYDEITWVSKHTFKIAWSDGHLSEYMLDFLRLNCPCAACQGHGEQFYRELPAFRVKEPKESMPPVEVYPVGSYAIGIKFSDTHDTGIFSFRFLRRFCPCELCRSEASGEPAST